MSGFIPARSWSRRNRRRPCAGSFGRSEAGDADGYGARWDSVRGIVSDRMGRMDRMGHEAGGLRRNAVGGVLGRDAVL